MGFIPTVVHVFLFGATHAAYCRIGDELVLPGFDLASASYFDVRTR